MKMFVGRPIVLLQSGLLTAFGLLGAVAFVPGGGNISLRPVLVAIGLAIAILGLWVMHGSVLVVSRRGGLVSLPAFWRWVDLDRVDAVTAVADLRRDGLRICVTSAAAGQVSLVLLHAHVWERDWQLGDVADRYIRFVRRAIDEHVGRAEGSRP